MRTFFECLPCFINQALGSLKCCNATDDQFRNIMRMIFCELADTSYDAAPPVTAQKIHRIISNATGIKDPYVNLKHRFNQFAAELLFSMQNVLELHKDVFEAKVKMSIAANIIDFGKNSSLTENDVRSSFEGTLDIPIDLRALSNLKEAIQEADKILFLCDNAGEIVFDRFLIDEIPHSKVTCAVRGAPVINDATFDDAQTVGLTEVVKVITNGSDAPGTILEDCSPEFNKIFNNADVIIAKGQGNFETLNSITSQRIFCLFKVKCPVIARDSGYPVGSFVIFDNQSAT
jgi:uncharacterized protein with ATP-grasp and redox domains